MWNTDVVEAARRAQYAPHGRKINVLWVGTGELAVDPNKPVRCASIEERPNQLISERAVHPDVARTMETVEGPYCDALNRLATNSTSILYR
jgi:hypothetical protein